MCTEYFMSSGSFLHDSLLSLLLVLCSIPSKRAHPVWDGITEVLPIWIYLVQSLYTSTKEIGDRYTGTGARAIMSLKLPCVCASS
jgi:hypothetical protein